MNKSAADSQKLFFFFPQQWVGRPARERNSQEACGQQLGVNCQTVLQIFGRREEEEERGEGGGLDTLAAQSTFGWNVLARAVRSQKSPCCILLMTTLFFFFFASKTSLCWHPEMRTCVTYTILHGEGRRVRLLQETRRKRTVCTSTRLLFVTIFNIWQTAFSSYFVQNFQEKFIWCSFRKDKYKTSTPPLPCAYLHTDHSRSLECNSDFRLPDSDKQVIRIAMITNEKKNNSASGGGCLHHVTLWQAQRGAASIHPSIHLVEEKTKQKQKYVFISLFAACFLCDCKPTLWFKVVDRTQASFSMVIPGLLAPK